MSIFDVDTEYGKQTDQGTYEKSWWVSQNVGAEEAMHRETPTPQIRSETFDQYQHRVTGFMGKKNNP